MIGAIHGTITMSLCIRIGECYKSFMVGAKILVYTLVKSKSTKTYFESTGNQLGLGLEDLLL